MFQFLRDLNEIYANDTKEITPTGKRYSLANVPVYKSFRFIDNSHESKRLSENKSNSFNLNRDQDEDGIVIKNRRRSDSYLDWDLILQEARSSIPDSEEGNARKKVYVKRNEIPDIASILGHANCDLLKDTLIDSDLNSQDDCLIEDYELEYYNFSSMINFDSESIDSTKETFERLSCIANELKFYLENESNDEEEGLKRCGMDQEKDSDHQINTVLIDNPDETIVHTIHQVTEKIDDQHDHGHPNNLMIEDKLCSDGEENEWINNPVEKILHTVHLINKISGEESSGSSTTNGTEETKEEDSIRSGEEDRMMSGVDEVSDGESRFIQVVDSPIQESSPRTQHSAKTSVSGPSFAFPILAAELPRTPPRMPDAKQRQGAPTRTHLVKHPRWRMLVCCRSVQ